MKTVNEKLECFDISRVSVTEPYLMHSLELETEYLLSLDADRWLAGFRETAGLDMKGCERYGGWENLLIGGHAFGHYLSACSQACKSPDIAAADKEVFLGRLRYIMDELKVCQDNSKGAPGFIFGAAILDKENVEKQFDNVEIRKTEIFTESWVPWYTMHKILQGIIDVYENTGYETALDVAKGLGLWTYNRASSWSEETHKTVLATEYGGMNDCLYELYAITQDERFAVAAHAFDEEPLYEKVMTGGENVLDGHHANTT
ncbi:MAG: glycoside hydrolase family 127 protein, partial [Lachnospiraceae bacterium]|nr:glycoside hydrolase family 127 protein [Lachnospiraceae bacterium]